MLTKLQSTIGYVFDNQKILKTALTHSSYANEHKANKVECNERLEFIGDSVLGFICAELLFKKFPNKQEGELSKMRSSLVCESALSIYAKQLNLGDYLYLGHGEHLAGGRERASTLSDAFEAVIAAIYLDGGMEKAKEFILPFLTEAILNQSTINVFNRDYKTTLQEIAQQNPGELISYAVVNEEGPDHNKSFTVNVYLNTNLLATGSGKSKKEAEQDAAKKALIFMGEEI